MFIIVGFKVKQERSVYYAKASTLEEMAKKVVYAFQVKDAEFVSLRRTQ